MQAKVPILSCRNLRVYLAEKEIVKGVDLDVFPGEKHAIMGPNGSGKSTMVSALMGHPAYRVEGEILIDGEPIQELPADERAKRGLFLGFQYPVAVPGVSVFSFLRAAATALGEQRASLSTFRQDLSHAFEEMSIPPEFAERYINDGFSGGEKKRMEILQLLMLKPKIALLDETDSGLDIDALKIVSEGIRKAASHDTGVLLVTHYQRILNYLQPDIVHVFMDGRIVKSGGPELAHRLEEKGYDGFAAALGGYSP
ncbi:MAG: Fe-S cluster assembly ATPase SufC [Myxococcales bacterium]|nr:MAG: Fe-S cluster assembly ATPase SufC [Myxococcales bacterium]